MQILKFEKDKCPACNLVENFLVGEGVAEATQHVNPFDDPEMAYRYDVTMGVPVVFLVNDAGEVLKRVDGFNGKALAELVDTYKSNN